MRVQFFQNSLILVSNFQADANSAIKSLFTWRNIYLPVASVWTISGTSHFMKLDADSCEDLLQPLTRWTWVTEGGQPVV